MQFWVDRRVQTNLVISRNTYWVNSDFVKFKYGGHAKLHEAEFRFAVKTHRDSARRSEISAFQIKTSQIVTAKKRKSWPKLAESCPVCVGSRDGKIFRRPANAVEFRQPDFLARAHKCKNSFSRKYDLPTNGWQSSVWVLTMDAYIWICWRKIYTLQKWSYMFWIRYICVRGNLWSYYIQGIRFDHPNWTWCKTDLPLS